MDRPAHLGWRLLALVYDLFPAFALTIAYGALITGVAALAGQPDLSDLRWFKPLNALGLWAAVGAYFVLSWARGGQTLGMRPWALRVVGDDGAPAARAALLKRYAWATLPAVAVIGLAGLVPWNDARLPFGVAAAVAVLGWLWAAIDRDRAPLHDRLSRTRLVRRVNAA
ncbi:MAG TPA: hypothetical protein DCM32_02135 [Xanthomonadaceae bacterium]|jgi:uncharacterized RDD family membrane protein YckC|nr:hypothetical protein [Xanthomonadaceae bacterium]